MKTKAIRLYGKRDIRLEEFELPELKEDEVLVKVMSDSLCMSTYKEVNQGEDHIRVPNDIATNPIIIGHEFSGEIVQVGDKWRNEYQAGKKFALLPGIPDSMEAPGYSFPYFGGDCTYCIVPNFVIEKGCLFQVESESFFEISAVEPLYCVIGGYHANIHLKSDSHQPIYSNRDGGNLIILGGCGPMGTMAIAYGLAKERGPKRIVVTDIDETKLDRMRELMSVEEAKTMGVELVYVNSMHLKNEVAELLELTDGEGYDDVFVYVPNQHVCEVGNQILAFDGCMNVFAGPSDKNFTANMNLYDSHYKNTKIIGSSGGLREDYIEALELISKAKVDPAKMITHIGGLDAVIDTTLNLPEIPGSKKLIYTHIEMKLTAIEDFSELAKTNDLYRQLAEVCDLNNGLWNSQAEKILLEHHNVL